jgi:flagellar export protein FliJ
MKRFRFPLQSVSTVRAWREQEAREQFAAAMHQLVAAEEALQQAHRRVEEVETLLRNGRLTAFRPAEQAGFLAAYHEELALAERAAQTRQDARAATDRAREHWQTRRGELRAVNQLEHRARLVHRLDEERAEQGSLDEIASIRASRASAASS